MRYCGMFGHSMDDPSETTVTEPPRRYRWPWFVLAAAVLGVVLAVLWMSREVERMRRIRELNAPASGTNASVLPGSKA